MIVVFSDLDGTLLDHDSYSFEPARPALELLKSRGVPLVLASSKTEAEMRPIAEAIGIDHPLIVENGAGVVGLGSFDVRDRPSTYLYSMIRQFLRELPKGLSGCFEGFGDWDAARVSAETGLTVEAARLAQQRLFSEPGHFSGDAAQRRHFLSLLDRQDLTAAQGGRFFTLMPKTSKAERMADVMAHYRGLSGGEARSVALGDAPNDLAMLTAADRGIIIPNPAHAPLPVTERERRGFILRAPHPGPVGWNHMIHQLVATGFV